MKRGFKRTILGAIFCSAAGFSILAFAQQRPEMPPAPGVPPPPSIQGASQQQVQSAMDAVAKLKKLNAALQQRVQELEAELAACKSQMQAAPTQTQAPKSP